MNRKNGRKRDINDVEMREILSELLPYIRIDHVIPPNNEVLNQAVRRGLISSPTICGSGPGSGSASASGYILNVERNNNKVYTWIRSQTGLFVRPRLFMPYYEEIKVRF